MHVAFLQPFGISTPSGGSRILRALLKDSPISWTSICTLLTTPQKAAFGHEVHLPPRPYFGRIERSRYNRFAHATERFFSGSFEKKLETVCRNLKVSAIHAIPHRPDFVAGYRVARKLGLPYFLNVHDDLTDTLKGHPMESEALLALAEIWRSADQRFVISEQMGWEYNIRYGERPFLIVTDGLERIAKPKLRPPDRLNIYFMGMFHSRYETNLRVLITALEIFRASSSTAMPKIILRCGSLGENFQQRVDVITVLPFGSEADVQTDLETADLLYLPLPFGEEHKQFVRSSLSTKMVTYLGSGIPILYHGPPDAAACSILREHQAAIIADRLDPGTIAEALQKFLTYPDEASKTARGAGLLAEKRFMISAQREIFWGSICNRLSEKKLTRK